MLDKKIGKYLILSNCVLGTGAYSICKKACLVEDPQ